MIEGKSSYILGHPIGHSKSPAMYNAVYEACGLPWSYGSMDLENEDEARDFIRQASFLSINITTPYKPLALAESQESEASARLAGGANLLLNEGEPGKPRLYAYNVDGLGCISYLEREGVTFAGANVAVCGTGPTAMSIMNAALRAGAAVHLLSRDADRARHELARYRSMAQSDGPNAAESAQPTVTAGSYAENESAIAGADIIIDATSLGMREGDPAPFDTHLMSAAQVVFDTVYGHGETALIAAAHAAGARALDGRGMLVGQAVATLDIVARAAGIELPLSHDRLFALMADAAGFSL